MARNIRDGHDKRLPKHDVRPSPGAHRAVFRGVTTWGEGRKRFYVRDLRSRSATPDAGPQPHVLLPARPRSTQSMRPDLLLGDVYAQSLPRPASAQDVSIDGFSVRALSKSQAGARALTDPVFDADSAHGAFRSPASYSSSAAMVQHASESQRPTDKPKARRHAALSRNKAVRSAVERCCQELVMLHVSHPQQAVAKHHFIGVYTRLHASGSAANQDEWMELTMNAELEWQRASATSPVDFEQLVAAVVGWAEHRQPPPAANATANEYAAFVSKWLSSAKRAAPAAVAEQPRRVTLPSVRPPRVSAEAAEEEMEEMLRLAADPSDPANRSTAENDSAVSPLQHSDAGVDAANASKLETTSSSHSLHAAPSQPRSQTSHELPDLLRRGLTHEEKQFVHVQHHLMSLSTEDIRQTHPEWLVCKTQPSTDPVVPQSLACDLTAANKRIFDAQPCLKRLFDFRS